MASTITVDNIIGKTATDNIHIPGHVVAYHETSGDFMDTSAEYTSPVELLTPSQRLSFSPKFSNSKLLVRVSGDVRWHSGSTGAAVFVYRDGSKLPVVSGNNPNNMFLYAYQATSFTNNHFTLSNQALYDANSTSSTTFTLYGGGQGGSVSFSYIPLTLSVMEIAQ